MAEEILTHVTPRGTSIGLDVGSKQVDLAKVLSAYGLRCARLDIELRDHDGEFLLGNGESMPFRDEALDYVVLSHVLAHVEHLDKFLLEIERVLKPGGLAFILQSNRYGWWKFWGYYLRRNDRRVHWRTFDIWGIRNTLAMCRLETVKIYAPYHFYLHAKYSDLFYRLDRQLEARIPNLFATQWLIIGRKVPRERLGPDPRKGPSLLVRLLVTNVAALHAVTLKAVELGLRLIGRVKADGEAT